MPLALLHAQVKSQTEAVQAFSPGEYVAYTMKRNTFNGKYLGELDAYLWEFEGTKPDPTYEGHGLVVDFYDGVTDGEIAKGKEKYLTRFIPDDPAFPIYFHSTSYLGNQEMQDRIGLVPKVEGNLASRLVFHEGLIYVIDDWKGPEEFYVRYVLEQIELPKNPIKRAKFGLDLKKRLEEMDPQGTMEAYFREAVPAQERAYATWIAQPANKAIVAEADRKREQMNDEFKKDREEYFSSEEYARVKENNRIADNAAAASHVTVENTGSSEVYIYEEGSRNGSRLSAGSSGTFSCKKALYVAPGASSDVNGGGRQFTSGGDCGSRISVP